MLVIATVPACTFALDGPVLGGYTRPILSATPVPVRATVCGLPAPLSVIVSVPVEFPAAVGEKITLITHDWPEGTETPQLFVSENVAPET